MTSISKGNNISVIFYIILWILVLIEQVGSKKTILASNQIEVEFMRIVFA